MRIRNTQSIILVAACVSIVGDAAVARADIDFKISGGIASDMRIRIDGAEMPSADSKPFKLPYPSQYRLLKNGFDRNENLIHAAAQVRIGDKVKGVADVDFYTYGYSDLKEIDDLTLRERVDPYRFEANAAYVDIYSILPHLDLRIGRQVVVWGAADKFNPTANVSPLDFSDPLLFGKALGNNMVRADWNPVGDWVLTGVMVPIFRPSQLPRTAPIALQDPSRPLSVQDDSVSARVQQLTPPASTINALNVLTGIPEPALNNVQYALRLSGRLLNQDVSLSYYHGRFSFPVPGSGVVKPSANGIPGNVDVDIGLVWPRMDVIGFDVAGTIPKLAGMGYWIEGAVIFPQEVTYGLYDDLAKGIHQEYRFTPYGAPGCPATAATPIACVNQVTIGPDGNYTTAPGGQRALINGTTPFAKVTVGGDISIGSHVYMNVQYVHGFFDEFGTGWSLRLPTIPGDTPRKEQRIGDYIVAGIDTKLAGDTVLLRLFTVWKLPSLDWWNTWQWDDYKFTAVIFPQLAWTVWDGTELSLGGLVFLGDNTTKFGDPATGASEIFTKAKITF